MNFKMRRPCANCPFLKKGGVRLRPGRLEGIVDTLRNDSNFFPCHKTIDYSREGLVEEDRVLTGKESVCMGSLAYMYHHHGRLPIVARLALMEGDLSIEDIEASAEMIRSSVDSEEEISE